jgi:hypothetical protein
MPAVQTAYSATLAVAVEGMLASMAEYNVDTKICETAAGIDFGRMVSFGAAYRGAVIGGTNICGITIKDITLANTLTDKYAQYENMGVLTHGDIWVKPIQAVVFGTTATYNTTTGQLDQQAAAGLTAIAHSKWMTSGAGGTVQLLRLTSTAP